MNPSHCRGPWTINTIEQIVRETCNPVVYRKQFSELSQLKEESINDFHTKLRACAVDCAFQCPYDPEHDLTEYHIVNRIRSAVYDEQLQHEILQKHEQLNTLDTLIKYCENFETTKKDSARLKSDTDNNNIGNVTLGDFVDDDISKAEIIAAISSYRRRKQHRTHIQVQRKNVVGVESCIQMRHAKQWDKSV